MENQARINEKNQAKTHWGNQCSNWACTRQGACRFINRWRANGAKIEWWIKFSRGRERAITTRTQGVCVAHDINTSPQQTLSSPKIPLLSYIPAYREVAYFVGSLDTRPFILFKPTYFVAGLPRLYLVGGMDRVKDGLCIKFGKLIGEGWIVYKVWKINRWGWIICLLKVIW